MNARDRLNEYLAGLTQRMRLAIATRASAVAMISVVVLVCAAVAWLAPLGFPNWGVQISRLALVIAIGASAAGLLWWPLKRLRNRGAALERQLPGQQGRIQTFVELHERQTQGQGAPLIDLLAEDALARAKQTAIDDVIAPRRLWIGGALAACALLALVYLVGFGSAQWGYGSRHLLLGATLPPEAVPVRQVSLTPGDRTLRRNADLPVQARVSGFKPEAVQLFVRFADSAEWERAVMSAMPGEEDGRYGLTLYALRAPLTYYALADGIKSPEYKINVVDVPRIDHMQVKLDYPSWTGLAATIETKARDIHAVADTAVEITVRASEPLTDAVLVLQDARVAMGNIAPNAGVGSFTVTEPGRYHIASRVAGDLVALTDDYEIAVVKDEPPTVEVVKPGRDSRATSVEEVPVTVRARDDFRVQQLELRYAVNGGDWKAVKLPAGTRQIDTRTLLLMEELGGATPLVPGDLVSYYAVAKDRKDSVQTDLFMIQVQPFERRFSEAQGGGGGGGGDASEQEQIAERQREILVATWNLERAREQKRRTPAQIKESADMLSGLQTKLAEQTVTLIERTRARTRGNTDTRVKSFLESLDLAAKAMDPAAKQLGAVELLKAVPNEQTALQMLLRAESAFRDIQVSRQQDGQGGGGSRASRDISELYELEMDLSKNKYETEKELSQESGTQNQELDAAVAKLKELAERQEKLAEQQRQQQQMSNAERWRQEQLRREAEELRRQLQELARQQSGQQSSRQASQQSGQQSGQQSSQSSGQSQGGQSSAEQVRDALNAVESALQAMRNAENAQSNASNQRANRQAAEEASRNLRQAARSIEQNAAPTSASEAVQRLAEQAKRAADAQRAIEMEMYQSVAQARDNEGRTRRDGLTQAQAEKLAEAKQALLDQVAQLENQMRDTAQGQRGNAPKTAERLGELVDDLASMNTQSRLSRAIIDLERGRADQALMGEGLITEQLQNTASDLRNTARLAQQEAEQRANAADPEMLLSELAQLRRALQEARQNAQANNQAPGQQSQQQGQQAGQQPGQQAGQQPGQQSGQQGGQPSGNQRGPGDQRVGGNVGDVRQQIGDGEAARINNALRQQLAGIQQRLNGGSITVSDIQALRAILPQVRRLAGNPIGDAQALANIERLELAALAAAEKERKQAGVRAGNTTPVAQEAEAVAEYYRRLAK